MRVLLSLLFAVLASCATNPTPRCETTDDCDRNGICYRGLCLPAMEVDGGPPPPCALGMLRCDEACVDPFDDRDHCGSCDVECRGREGRCDLGACVR